MGDFSLLEKDKLLIQNILFIAMNEFQSYDYREEHGVLSFLFARHHKGYTFSLL
mgnify:FL=1